MAACKACMAAIVWIKTPAGKSIPCDATPRYYIEKPPWQLTLIFS